MKPKKPVNWKSQGLSLKVSASNEQKTAQEASAFELSSENKLADSSQLDQQCNSTPKISLLTLVLKI